MRRPVVLLLVAVLVTAGLVGVGLTLAGVLGGDDQPTASRRPTPTASFTTTPLSAYDAGGAVEDRDGFCDRIDPRQIAAALGGDPSAQRAWTDGDRTRLGAGPTDVSHEFGCEYVGADETTARAWVFAPPVRTSTATRLSRQTDGRGTCTSTASTFGTPSSLLTCETGQQRSATYRGLFGDAWLSCELDAPLAVSAADLADRAGRWCVGIAQADAPR